MEEESNEVADESDFPVRAIHPEELPSHPDRPVPPDRREAIRPWILPSY